MLLAEVRALHAHRLHDAPFLGDAHVALRNLRHSGCALAVLLVSKRSRSCAPFHIRRSRLGKRSSTRTGR